MAVVFNGENMGIAFPIERQDRLQWKCDNLKSLAYEFYKCSVPVDEIFVGLDTSQVTSVERMFMQSSLATLPFFDTSNVTNMNYFAQANTRLKTLPFYDLSNVKGMQYAFGGLTSLTSVPAYNTKKVTTMNSCLGSTKITTFPDWDFSSVTDLGNFLSGCNQLVTADVPYIANAFACGGMFSYCSGLTNVSMDLLNATTIGSLFFFCNNLTNLNLKNIKISGLQIGSGTSWGHLLTVDSLVNTIQELWDNSSSTSVKNLTIGTANKAKLTDVYVKLVDITDEMRTEDEYIDNKKPCVVCESTDEGAMLIEEYAVLKNWALF